MIYPDNFEEKIGFLSLRKYLVAKCLGPLGVAECDKMEFSSDFKEISLRLQETDEMLKIIQSGVELPVINFHDVTPYLSEIRVEGGYMIPERLYRLKTSLETIGKIRSFFEIRNPESETYVYPVLSQRFKDMSVFPGIVRRIDEVLDKFGNVKDSATTELSRIRSSIHSVTSSMSSIVRRVMERCVQQGIVERDAVPAMRDGRLVIPVSSMMKRQINGIVHDESSTGKTAFVEPVEVVEANNRLRELENEEKREIIRILVMIADEIRPDIPQMLQSYLLLGYFDFVRAKALLAEELKASLPSLSDRPELEWYHAVHPALFYSLSVQGREVVPLDIRLDKNHRILIISGPNAGGKSVCLKTVGIVQYMMQCGMLPTLYSNSHMGVFSDILIDIGDEQSIENDLSTYSSHLKNMRFFVTNASSETLLLADEMGSGTEPQIGGALAQAILFALNKKRVWGVVTTHYQNLKTFASSEEGFINGAMLYDRQRLRPMFQLSIGNPGSSFALEIAKKTGLPQEIIDNAREIVGSDYVNMDKYLLDLARDKRYWANKRLSIKEKEKRIDSALSRHEERAELLKLQRSDIIKQAKDEARQILEKTNSLIERTIRDIRKSQADKEKTKEVRRQLEEYKKDILSTDAKDDQPSILKVAKRRAEKTSDPVGINNKGSVADKTSVIEPGNYVRMTDGGVVGKVLSVSGKKAEVAFGGLRTIVELSRLKLDKKPKESQGRGVLNVAKSTSDDIRERQLSFNRELDVRGMRADEALQAVTYFLDDALQFNADRVRILHGTGTGALRSVIRGLLGAHSGVESYHDEDVRFGGAGITVVNLD